MTKEIEMNLTQEMFLSQYATNAELAKAVIAQMGDYETFSENAPCINSHGIAGGYNGFIYYTDTVKFAEENYENILLVMKDDIKEMGCHCVPEFMQKFQGLKDYSQDEIAEVVYGKNKEHDDYDIMFNALAWYAATKASYDYVYGIEDGESDSE